MNEKRIGRIHPKLHIKEFPTERLILNLAENVYVLFEVLEASNEFAVA